MAFLWSIIIGGILGWIAGLVLGRDVPWGIWGNILAGFVGSWLGNFILGSFGPTIAGFAIIPSIIGAAIFIFILTALLKNRSKSSR